MQTCETVAALRGLVARWREDRQRVALVPTMGNLHEGHLALVRLARAHAERVVCSIFVNPTQFGPGEDFDRYPRTPEEDRARLAAEGVDALFLPGVDAMYPYGADGATRVSVPEVGAILCGAHRPGHFDGVATVVLRLLNMAQPDVAVFGQKDFQQLFLIRRLVRDLCLSVDIEAAPISRETDGLARSSRNRYLDPEARARAPALHRALRGVADAIAAGEGAFDALAAQARAQLRNAGLEPDYVEVRCVDTLAPAWPEARPLVVLGAARLAGTRLIDNLIVD